MKRVTKDITCCAGCPAMTHSTTFGIWYCNHSATAEATPDLRERKATMKGFRDYCPLPDVDDIPVSRNLCESCRPAPKAPLCDQCHRVILPQEPTNIPLPPPDE